MAGPSRTMPGKPARIRQHDGRIATRSATAGLARIPAPATGRARWEALHGDQRVQQADWLWPRRGDWMAQLDEAILADARPTLLVAHSLGCHLVAAWAAHSQHTSPGAGCTAGGPARPRARRHAADRRALAAAGAAAAAVPGHAAAQRRRPVLQRRRARAMAAAWGAAAHSVGAGRPRQRRQSAWATGRQAAPGCSELGR